MHASKPNILLTLAVPADLVASARAAFPQFVWIEAQKERILEQAAQAEIIFGPPRVEHAAAAKKLKWLQSSSAGVEKIALSEVFQKGVFALTTAAGLHDSCAEHTLALLLALTRQVGLYARTAAAAGAGNETGAGMRPYAPEIWERRKGHGSPRVLHGQTLGLLGLGAIGRAVARIAKAMGMRVFGVSYHGKPVPECDETHPVAQLDELLPRMDVLVLLLPAAPETTGLLSAARIAKLPRHALVVNAGRGSAIDEPALIAALRDGRIAGAGLDVFAKEPLPPDSPLYGLPNVVLTPHIGGNRPDYAERAFEIFVGNLERWVRGEPLRNVVERERGY